MKRKFTAQTPISDLLDAYLRRAGQSPKSELTYRSAVRAFDRHCGQATVGHLTAEHVEAWRMSLADHSPATVRYYVMRIRTLWRFAAATAGIAGPSATTRRLSEEDRAKRYLQKLARQSAYRKLQRLKATGLTDEQRKELREERRKRQVEQRRENRRQRMEARQSKGPRQWPFQPEPRPVSPPPGPIAKPSPETTLRDYYQGVYSRMKLSIRSPKTRRLYGCTLKLFEKFLGRPAFLGDLTDDTVTALLCWILDVGLSPRTANKSRDQLLAIWRFAARKRHVDLWPDVEPVKEPKRAPIAWTLEQFSKLVAVARSYDRAGAQEPSLCGVPFALWWSTLFLVLYDTGIRIGAAMQLRCEHYDRPNKRLFVPAEIQKQNADQVLFVSEETHEVLCRLIDATQRETLFPWPYSLSYIYHRLNRLLKQAGLPTTRFDKFHKVRKTSATMIEKFVGPGAATIHLGHSSPKVTERYLDRTMLPMANVVASLPRPTVGQIGGVA